MKWLHSADKDGSGPQLAVLGAFWNLNLLSSLIQLSVSLVAQESNKILNSILKNTKQINKQKPSM